MKPTSLSPEFYENLYNEIICNFDFDPDVDDIEETHCSTYIEAEDFEGYYICFKATFEYNVIDDSFDHAFGIEHGCHAEVGELIDIEEVTMYDEPGNDVSKLFDYDAFFEQFKRYEAKIYGGAVIKAGDTVLAHFNGNRWIESEFLYRDTLKECYICRPVGRGYSISCKRVLLATDDNRSRFLNR